MYPFKRRPPAWLFALAFLLCAGLASAQTVSLAGTVRDNSANPIANADVTVVDSVTQTMIASGVTLGDGSQPYSSRREPVPVRYGSRASIPF